MRLFGTRESLARLSLALVKPLQRRRTDSNGNLILLLIALSLSGCLHRQKYGR